MEKSSNDNSPLVVADDDDQVDSFISTLPKAKGWIAPYLSQYEGFWYPSMYIKNVMSVQKNFDSQDEDVVLVTFPKSGTTWLKALIFSIMNRHRYTLSTTPLLTTSPHELVPFLEVPVLLSNAQKNKLPHPSRLFSTHIPYNSLPESIKSSRCKIVYICRNPLDIIVSFWHFASRIKPESKSSVGGRGSIDELVELYCEGKVGYGPFWEHMLGYWKKSVEMPEKLMFLKYEDLKEDTTLHIRKLASFIGFPFSAEEEKDGVIDDIAELCSFSNMKDMEVNKTGIAAGPNVENKAFFRKGEVGDWVNCLSPSMVENIDKLMQEKFVGSGLIFKLSN